MRMKYCVIVIQFLIIVFCLRLEAYWDGLFSTNSTIVHPETGLFFDYIGSYVPSEMIIHASAVFPMTTATCHFLPLSAAENIRSCNITKKRTKRFVDVVSLGVGTAALTMSVSNSIQISNLQQQVEAVENSLSHFSQTVQIHGAHLVKLTSKHIKLAEELELTQRAIDNMIPVLNSHAEAINSVRIGVEKLSIRYRNSFLYLAISQICRDELTLSFLSPDDMHKLVYFVIKEGNLTFSSSSGSLPIAEIITRLLVRQQIDFIPSSRYLTETKAPWETEEEIGRLVITSYFAVPISNQSPFHVYKLVTIPFFHQNKTLELSHIPHYWAINPVENSTMQWHNPKDSGCDFHTMITCRDTPPIRAFSEHVCIDEIVQRQALSGCQTSIIRTADYFLRQLKDNFWITSSPKPIECMKVQPAEFRKGKQLTWSMSEKMILAPLSFVNVTEGYMIVCPGFTLTGRQLTTNVSSLVILNENGLLTKNISIVNVHQYIAKNTSLYRTNLEEHKQLLTDFVSDIQAIPQYRKSLSTYTKFFRGMSFSWTICTLVGAVLFLIYRWKRRNN